jgi:hypothetical protein
MPGPEPRAAQVLGELGPVLLQGVVVAVVLVEHRLAQRVEAGAVEAVGGLAAAEGHLGGAVPDGVVDVRGVDGEGRATGRDHRRRFRVAALAGPDVPERMERVVLEEPGDAARNQSESGEDGHDGGNGREGRSTSCFGRGFGSTGDQSSGCHSSPLWRLWRLRGLLRIRRQRRDAEFLPFTRPGARRPREAGGQVRVLRQRTAGLLFEPRSVYLRSRPRGLHLRG